MKATDPVVFKGTRNGVLVILNDAYDFSTLKERLIERLAEAEKFFYAGAGVTIDVGSRVLTSGELLELEQILGMGNGLKLANVVHTQASAAAAEGGWPATAAERNWWGGASGGRELAAKAWQAARSGAVARGPQSSAQAPPGPVPAASRVTQVAPLLALPVDLPPASRPDIGAADHRRGRGAVHPRLDERGGTEPSAAVAPPAVPTAGAGAAPPASAAGGAAPVAAAWGETVLIKRTLRSGQQIRHAGNVVVLGDVNPGAEVVATGDIVIMGVLRGVAWAGCKGDLGAVVAAFRLQPTQLRIGHLISRPPDGEPVNPSQPEMAYVRGGNVIIDAYPTQVMLEGQGGQ